GLKEAAEMSSNNINLTSKAPELLDQNRQLAFHLKQQHLIDDALSYA
ncbi:unnamed protein product, partial [Adineta steineri]